MIKTGVLLLFLFSFPEVHSQPNFFVLKKNQRTIQRFSTGSFITFQTYDYEWTSGFITRIANDSFYVNRIAIRMSMSGPDTVHFGTIGLSLTEVKTMPRPTAAVVFRNDRPHVIRGHEKFAYVKNGLIFQVGGGGYAFLNVTNSLIKNQPPFKGRNAAKLGIAAAVFAVGEVLRRTYKQHLPMGKKFYLREIKIE